MLSLGALQHVAEMCHMHLVDWLPMDIVTSLDTVEFKDFPRFKFVICALRVFLGGVTISVKAVPANWAVVTFADTIQICLN